MIWWGNRGGALTMRTKHIFLLIVVVSLLLGLVAYYQFRAPAVGVVVSPIPASIVQNIEPVPHPSGDRQAEAVTLYAYEKGGNHIFDGAVIVAMNTKTGKIVAEQVADGNGKVTFALPWGTYRFQPSPSRENRVVGSLGLSVPLEENKPQTLLLTEIGPAGFGTPVDTCDEKKEALNLALEQANYCEVDADCKVFQPGGFGCFGYVNKSFDGSMILQRVDDYGRMCPLTAYKCPGTPRSPICVQGVCRVGN